MAAASDAAEQGAAIETLTDRERRALTEYLTVDVRDGAGLFTVYSEDGTPRAVDLEAGRCDCPDSEYNAPGGRCKHVHAAAFLAGDREVPAWVDADDICARLTHRAADAVEGGADR
ncbi:SWIM zinc finger family protein [Candidatus Halobonum tyrrellensis]|uniref:SWIM-type domain-containing protein n=1 Tax=Candidatus Halobonum tyrrellensis G22 TaxID=1324957 RepID=V4GN08_9EURY|nr:SWIM zinc finger family protein [Candidatus Halobonum tyrrellensis]ESP86786.1 hypothetical protein K933_17352 [Candidatus Halobonum tyrrellensis G22]